MISRKATYYFFIFTSLLLIGWIGGGSRLIRNGNAHYAAGEYDAAFIAYQQAVEQRPDDPISRYNLGTVLYKKGQFAQAADAFRYAFVTKDLNFSAQIYYNLGNAQVQLGDLNGAVRSYKSALRLNPADLDAKYNLELAIEKLNSQHSSKPGVGQSRAEVENSVQPPRVRETPKTRPGASTPAPVPDPMSKANALKLLETFSNDETALREHRLRKKFTSRQKPEKDW
jgi:Ca-activated chloride channel homolog